MGRVRHVDREWLHVPVGICYNQSGLGPKQPDGVSDVNRDSSSVRKPKSSTLTVSGINLRLSERRHCVM